MVGGARRSVQTSVRVEAVRSGWTGWRMAWEVTSAPIKQGNQSLWRGASKEGLDQVCGECLYSH